MHHCDEEQMTRTNETKHQPTSQDFKNLVSKIINENFGGSKRSTHSMNMTLVTRLEKDSGGKTPTFVRKNPFYEKNLP